MIILITVYSKFCGVAVVLRKAAQWYLQHQQFFNSETAL